MGWASGTGLFDSIVGRLLPLLPDGYDQYNMFLTLIEEFEKSDWDTVEESRYWQHPAFEKAIRELHPDWDYG
ncbi:MAG: hypothetical protein ACXABY_01165 [Candidatus Thorarchaeota archaeon]|jgi:hypothetical protein